MPERECCACFTGHRELPGRTLPALVQALDQALEATYARGYRYFYNGGALGFDLLAAERVLAMQRRHPEVSLEIAIPHGHQTDGWPADQRVRYERIVYLANVKHELSPLYYPGCYHVRNRYMVDHSALCICYFVHPKGGTASTVAYAAQQELCMVNLAIQDSWKKLLGT